MAHKESLAEFGVCEKKAASVQTPSAWSIGKGFCSALPAGSGAW